MPLLTSRLFWKILVGMWIAFTAIIHAVWFLFVYLVGTGTGRAAFPPQVFLIAIVGGLIFSSILAWYLTMPIRNLSQGFDRLAGGDFTVRLTPGVGRRRDELADLARDFDRMAIRLSELVSARERLLADVSHELRTPLARLGLAAELAAIDPSNVTESLARIRTEATKIETMVSELLDLARLEGSNGRPDDYFDVAAVLDHVVSDAACESDVKNVRLHLAVATTAGQDSWIVPGSGNLASRALENVLRNAIRYSPEANDIQITLEEADDFHRVVISDNGPGLAPEVSANLFAPFNISADGSGFGLGLAIAQRVITAQGGSIVARNRSPHGLDMIILFPSFRHKQTRKPRLGVGCRKPAFRRLSCHEHSKKRPHGEMP